MKHTECWSTIVISYSLSENTRPEIVKDEYDRSKQYCRALYTKLKLEAEATLLLVDLCINRYSDLPDEIKSCKSIQMSKHSLDSYNKDFNALYTEIQYYIYNTDKELNLHTKLIKGMQDIQTLKYCTLLFNQLIMAQKQFKLFNINVASIYNTRDFLSLLIQHKLDTKYIIDDLLSYEDLDLELQSLLNRLNLIIDKLPNNINHLTQDPYDLAIEIDTIGSKINNILNFVESDKLN